jgi:hypothetical protein
MYVKYVLVINFIHVHVERLKEGRGREGGGRGR